MKKLLSVLLVMLLLVQVVGCGKTEEAVSSDSELNVEDNTAVSSDDESEEKAEKVVIRYGFWGSEEELNVHTENAKNVQEVFPNIEIEIQHYPSSEDFWNTLPAQIAADTAPDILKITNEGAYEYISGGLFANLDTYIKEAELDMTEYTESAMGIWNIDDSTYGIPVSVAPAMFFINTDLWQAAGLGDYPTTWDEVKDAAKAMTNEDTYGLIINLHEYHLTNYALSFGGGWGNGTTINSPENVQALETVFSMYEEGIAISPSALGFGWDGEVFANGKGAMSTGGYWYKGYLKNAAPDLNYAAIPVPAGTTQGCTSHSDAIVVLEDSKNKLEATKAAYYLTNDMALENLMESVGINPAKKELASQYYEINTEFAAIEAIVPFAKDFGYPVDTKKFSDALIHEVEYRVLGDGDKTAQQILDEVQASFEE